MDAINLPVTRNTIRWTNAPVPGRHAGQPDTKHVTGRWAHRPRNQRHPTGLTLAGGRNTLAPSASRHMA